MNATNKLLHPKLTNIRFAFSIKKALNYIFHLDLSLKMEDISDHATCDTILKSQEKIRIQITSRDDTIFFQISHTMIFQHFLIDKALPCYLIGRFLNN